MAGRPKKPTALRILEGNVGHRPLNQREPKPTPTAPTMPAWMLPEAKREWRRVAPELERLGLLTRVDGAALATYCQAYAQMVKAERTMKVEGTIFRTRGGYLMPRPEVAIAQQSARIVKAFCTEFGLTPAARGRMTLPEVETDDLDTLLRDSG